jgi:hypothetical protein
VYDSSESKIVVGHFYDSPRFVIKCRTSDVLPFGGLWYTSDDAVSYANFYSRSHDAVIRVYDAAGNVIEMHERKGDFRVS